jgi:hypothetical protein
LHWLLISSDVTSPCGYPTVGDDEYKSIQGDLKWENSCLLFVC